MEDGATVYFQGRSCPFPREDVLVDQTIRHVSLYTRPQNDSTAADWARQDFTTPESRVLLPSLGVPLSLADIYAGIEPI